VVGIVLPDAVDPEGWGLQRRIGDQERPDTVPLFNFGDCFAFLVQ